MVYDVEAGDGVDEDESLILTSCIDAALDDVFWAWDASKAKENPTGYAEYKSWLDTHFRGIQLKVDSIGKLVIHSLKVVALTEAEGIEDITVS